MAPGVSGGSIPSFIGARCYNSTNLSIGNSSLTTLTFDTNRFDTSSFHSTVSNTSRLVAPSTAYYHIGAHIAFAASATGYRQLQIELNGLGTVLAVVSLPSSSASVNSFMQVNTLWKLSASDYVEIKVLQTSGGALNVNASPDYSPEAWIYEVGT